MKDKDFNSEEVEQMKKFYHDSFYFPYMQSFGDTLSKCGDLSQLWYKEFYLELSKEIQVLFFFLFFFLLFSLSFYFVIGGNFS